jgi:hypothetical protein
MWATLAVSAVLAAVPADAGSIQIKNDRFTYGFFGPERKDSQVIPGDVLVVAFDVEGLAVQDDGMVKYSMSLELLDKDGASKYKDTSPVERETVNALGGSLMPCWSRVNVGSDTPAGEYTVRITVADRAAKDSKPGVLEKKFTVVAPQFGIIVPMLGYDKPPTAPPPAPAVAVPGQTLLFYFGLVGLDAKPGKTAQDMLTTDFTLDLTILDDATGKPTLTKPFTGAIKSIPPDAKDFWPGQFPLTLNRSGKFTIVLTVNDKQGNKTAKLDMPLTVVDVK